MTPAPARSWSRTPTEQPPSTRRWSNGWPWTGVEWAVGFGAATDVRPAGVEGAQAVAIRSFLGALPLLVETSGWDERPGTALVGVDAIGLLGFETPAGPVDRAGDGGPVGVVGWVRAQAPLGFLNRALLTVPDPDQPVIRVVALATAPHRVAAVAAAIAAVAAPADPSSVSIQTSETLVQVRAAVQGELGAYGRNLATLVLGAGLVLTALNVYGAVTARRRDFGRRRALGASRPDIVALVTTQSVATAVVGAAVGAAAGTVIVDRTLGTAPQPAFVVAVAVLAVLASALAALLPATIAAYARPRPHPARAIAARP